MFRACCYACTHLPNAPANRVAHMNSLDHVVDSVVIYMHDMARDQCLRVASACVAAVQALSSKWLVCSLHLARESQQQVETQLSYTFDQSVDRFQKTLASYPAHLSGSYTNRCGFSSPTAMSSSGSCLMPKLDVASVAKITLFTRATFDDRRKQCRVSVGALLRRNECFLQLTHNAPAR